MYKYQYLAIAFSTALLLGCDSGKDNHDGNTVTTEEIIYIDHYKTHCTTGPNGLCLRSKTDGDDQWYSTNDGIQDFHYEWGHRYKVKVRKKAYTDREAPGDLADYFLLEVLEDNVVEPNTLFMLIVYERARTALSKVEENLYWYGGEKLVTCKSYDCSAIESFQDQDLEILIEATYQESVDDPLMITQVLCAAPGGLTFDRDCLHKY